MPLLTRSPALIRGALLALLVLIGLPYGAPGANAKGAPSAPDILLTIGSANVSPGSSVSIPVTIAPSRDVASYNIEIGFDPEALEITSIKPEYGSTDDTACLTDEKGCIRTSFDNAGGWLRAAWVDSSTGSGSEHPIVSKQLLFTIEAKAKSKTGTQAFTVDSSNPESLLFTGAVFTNDQPNPLTVSVASGGLSVFYASPGSSGSSTSADLPVYIDGQAQPKSATVTRSTVGSQTLTSIAVDNDAVASRIESNQTKTVLLDARGDASNAIVSKLNGKLVKAMESKEAVLQIETDKGGYTLPASQVRIDAIASKFGTDIDLRQIDISVRIADAGESEQASVQRAAAGAGASQVGKPVSFEVEASYNGSVVSIDRFNSYVERSMKLPDDADPSKITTGVVLNADGSLTHVPTNIVEKDGKYYATIRSLTNSVYSVIYHPKTFADVATHWSRQDVDDLASRLVINGATDTAFEPNRVVTRAEYVSILARGLGLHDAPASASAYADVSDGSWYAPSVASAVYYGLANGYGDGTFKPNAPITRAEAMSMLAKAMKIIGVQPASGTTADDVLAPFADAGSVAAWAKDDAAAVVGAGLAQGSDGKLNPGAGITRAETAAVVRRLLVKSGYINDTH